MNWKNLISWKKIVALAIAIAVLLLAWAFMFRGTGAVNPKTSVGRETDAGEDNAPYLFKFGELYTAIEQNGYVLNAIQSDIILFARTTRLEFKDPKTLVGFTFNKGVEKSGEEFKFTGHYYGFDDKIQISLTPHGRGVYTLSITNLVDNTNIDSSLKLNGKRNAFIRTLPLQEEYFSIRYQQPEDRVVVTFYDGYSAQDVDKVEKLVSDALGSAYNSTVVYSINRIGIFGLDKIRENLTNPIEAP